MKPHPNTIRARMKKGMTREQAESTPTMTKSQAGKMNKSSSWRKPGAKLQRKLNEAN